MKFKLSFSTFTDVGDREVNEDSLSAASEGENNCFVLCDGLGGHGMGDIASSLVVNTFIDQFKKNQGAKNILENAFCISQEALLEEQKVRNARKKMKTTATALVTDDKNAYIGHVGDSRVYIFQRNKVKARTLDHSIPQMLVLSKEIKENEIRYHPDRNILLRVLGVEWEENQYELMPPVPLKKCQAFLLCSDGFWELIEENEMCRLLKESGSVKEWIERMAEAVKANGVGKNMDNYSAIGVWCEKMR